MLAWIDLETTGLDPAVDKVLEVACVVTDDNFVEVARWSAVTNAARDVAYHELRAVVQAMHRDNGLWMESLASTLQVSDPPDTSARVAEDGTLTVRNSHGTFIESSADSQLFAFLRKHAVKRVTRPDREDPSKTYETDELPQLAGSTISFDREFLRQLPLSLGTLHHRNVDVSTLNELARRLWPAVHEKRPGDRDAAGTVKSKHRAMDDILASIDVLRYYVTTFVAWGAMATAYAAIPRWRVSYQVEHGRGGPRTQHYVGPFYAEADARPDRDDIANYEGVYNATVEPCPPGVLP